MSSGLANRIEEAIAPSLLGMGFAVVLVRILEAPKRRTVQILAEKADGSSVSLEDCANISRAAGTLLEVADPIEGAYDLEVSSPGLNRPLVKLADYSRFQGREAKVETREAIEGRKRFKGRIEGVEGELITLELADGGGRVALPFAEIASAKLEVTEAELRAALKKGKEKA